MSRGFILCLATIFTCGCCYAAGAESEYNRERREVVVVSSRSGKHRHHQFTQLDVDLSPPNITGPIDENPPDIYGQEEEHVDLM